VASRIWILALVVVAAGCTADGMDDSIGFEPVLVSGGEGSARTPCLVPADENLLVLWSEDRGEGPDLWFRIYDRKGQSLGPATRLTDSGRARRPQVVRLDQGWVVAWSDRVDGMMEVLASGFAPESPGLLQPVNISDSGVFPSVSPSLAAYGEQALLVWVTRRIFLHDPVMLLTLDFNGQPVGDAFEISETTQQPYRAQVATSGKRILVVSNEYHQLFWKVRFASLTRPGGEPEQSRPFEADASHWAPVVAPVDGGFQVAFRNNGPILPVIESVKLNGKGEPEGVPVTVQTLSGFVHEPAVLSDGDRAAIVWREETEGSVALRGAWAGNEGDQAGAETIFPDAGLGDPVSGFVIGNSVCASWETLTEGVGAIRLGCFAVPGGES
jgi:hypothetical protein